MWVLGLNAPPAGWHDSAACLVDGDGEIIAFSEEERHNRRRHSLFRRPDSAARLCLDTAGISASDIDVVAIGWDSRQLYPDLSDAEFLSGAVGLDFGKRSPEVVYVGHHRAHAASSFYASPFQAAGVLVVDGHGENESSSIWTFMYGRQPRLERSWGRASSLGYAYDAASTWLGFSFLDAGKTMGLAAYGRAGGVAAEPLVEVTADDFRLAVRPAAEDRDSDKNGHATAHDVKALYDRTVAAWRKRYASIVGADGPSLRAGELDGDRKAVRVAYMAQRIIEETVTGLAALSRKLSGHTELCLSGGVALNCSTNGTLPGPLYVPPVPHDAGVALGAAWIVSPPRKPGSALSPFLGTPLAAQAASGPQPSAEQGGLSCEPLDIEAVTSLLLDGCVGAVAEGRAEVGPRALCHRSIIAIPDTPQVATRVNAIKRREPWRPFAGVAREQYAARLWECQEHLSRYMLGAAKVGEMGRGVAPAVVHVDGTTRPQVLYGDEAPVVGSLLDALDREGKPPVLLNTSFNDRGMPIVDTAADALAEFQAMDLDFLILGDMLYRKHA